MALKPPPPPWEILAQVGDLVGGSDVRTEVDKNMRSLAQEFDAQLEILKRTKARVSTLEAELEALTAELEQLTKAS